MSYIPTENDLIRWKYNCWDITYTKEVLDAQREILSTQDVKLQQLYRRQIDKLSPATTLTMNRGVRINKTEKERLYIFFSKLMEDIKLEINDILGFEFNINSSPQKKKLFSEFFGIKLKVSRKSKTETCDSAAMLDYIKEYPLYAPFLSLLLEYASLKVFTTNFLGMRLDDDDRARTQYKIAGTNTGRLASVKNVWGNGGNFQNLPEKGKIKLKYALEVHNDTSIDGEDYYTDLEDSIIAELSEEGSLRLPNVKKIFIPDEGKEIGDLDYSGADIMIVAATSECKWLLDYFSKPRDKKVYAYIASEFFQRDISDKSNEYKKFKGIFHGLNYLMGIDKLALLSGVEYNLAKQLRDFYFSLNPEILLWHERVGRDISSKGYVSNAFGRRAWFLNRNDKTLMNKAVAFEPQAGIADLVNLAWIIMLETFKGEVEILLQVHDSLVVQYPIEKAEYYRTACKEAMEIALPYKQPLIIPADIKVSTISYGDCKKLK
jgi:DNA polymerase-1